MVETNVSVNLFILARLHRKPKAYLKRSRVSFLGLEPVLGVYSGDLKNAPIVRIEPVTSRLLCAHQINYATAIFLKPYVASDNSCLTIVQGGDFVEKRILQRNCKISVK